MRESLRVRIDLLRGTIDAARGIEKEPTVAFRLRESWGVATRDYEAALPVFGDVPATRAVLDELGTVIDALGELIS